MLDGFISISDQIPFILSGVWVTATLTAVAMMIGVPLGLTLTFVRLLKIPVLSQVCILFIEFFLLTPPLIHIIWAYYVLPIAFDLRFDPVTICGLALSLSVGAQMAETFRSGLQAIPATQHRAARVLGLSTIDRYRLVILPQTLRIILGPSTNVLVSLVKDTSLVAVIGVSEILHRAELSASLNFRFLEILTLVGLIYAAINYPLILLAKRFEAHAKRGFSSV